MTEDQVELRRNDAEGCYEVHVGNQRVGLATFQDLGYAVDLPHTEVHPSMNGRGLGGQLVRFALDDARAMGRKVIPSCPFVATFIKRHPEYADLV
jgi:predicted GNAT family acetyltransferase